MHLRAAKALLVLALSGTIAYLALRTSPHLQYIPWMPRSLGVWADRHGVLRNVVAFFALALVVLALLRPRAGLVLALGVFATALEVAQIWIPGRVFDPRDIAASLAGILLACPLAWALHRLPTAR